MTTRFTTVKSAKPPSRFKSGGALATGGLTGLINGNPPLGHFYSSRKSFPSFTPLMRRETARRARAPPPTIHTFLICVARREIVLGRDEPVETDGGEILRPQRRALCLRFYPGGAVT